MSPWKAAIIGIVAAAVMEGLGSRRTAPDRRRDRRGVGPPRGRCVGDPRRRLARDPQDKFPSGAGGSSRSASSSMASRHVSSGRSASVTSSRSSIDASRFASTQRESSPASTSPSTAPRPRSLICSRTWTSIIGPETSPDLVRAEPHIEVGRSLWSTTVCSEPSSVARSRCSCSL